MRRGLRHALTRVGVGLLLSLVLGLVFLSYAQPDLMQQLGDRLWACF
jgi:HD-like signal output (HDOD) protein